MKAAAQPANEAARLAALRDYAIVDTLPEPRFDALTKLAANILDVPIALISFVCSDREWFKSAYGIALKEAPRELAFCSHVVADNAPLVVNDARSDPRFSDHPFVTGGPELRFYAGMPLRTREGFVLGAICALDHQVRTFSEDSAFQLSLLADEVVELLELQRQHLEAARELQAFTESSPIPLQLVSDTGAIAWANAATYESLGYTRDTFLGMDLREIVGPKGALDDVLERLREGASVKEFEAVVRMSDGRYRTWLFDCIPHRESDRVEGSRWVGRDVTEELAARAALARRHEEEEKSESARLEAVLKTVSSGIVITDSAGVVHSFNRTAERMFGYSADEIIGRPVPLFGVNGSAGSSDAPMSRFALTALPRVLGQPEEVVGIRKDGRSFPVELTVSEMRAGRAESMFVGVARDITARREAERALREFKTTLDLMQDGIFMFEVGTLALSFANRGAVNHIGYSLEELYQKTPLDLAPLLDTATYCKLLMGLVVGEFQVATFETTHRHRDGHDIAVEITLQYIAPEDEAPRFISLVREIEERKRADRVKNEFVSVVSHELRTPLTSIRGALGLVSSGVTGALPPQAKEYIDIALSNCERLVRLINDILDIERIQTGTLELRNEPVDLASVIKKAVVANEAFAVAHGVGFSVVSSPRRIEVVGDEDRLMQVLTNLLSNAVKFSPQGHWVEISVVLRGTRVRVNVRDHGPGVPEEFRSRIFQRFAQAGAAEGGKKGGTGLGLSISQGIVLGMKGDIGFENAIGGGTNFFFDLPWLPSVLDSAPSSSQEQHLVLVCEDDLDVAHVIMKVLAEAGCLVHVAPTLARARELLRRHHYDALTLDLMLADGQSVDLVREMRQNPATEQVPIVVVSGDSPGEAREKLGSAAVSIATVLEKPVAEETLKAAIRSAVTRVQSGAPRVLHVEDDADLQRIVRHMLPGEWIVDGATSLAAARSLLAQNRYDIVLLDLVLPDGPGESLLDGVGRAEVVVFSGAEPPSATGRRVARALVKARTDEFELRDTVLSLINRRTAGDSA